MSFGKKIKKLLVQWRAIVFLTAFGMISTVLWTNIGRGILFAEANARYLLGNYGYDFWHGGAFFLLAWAINWCVAELFYCIMILVKTFILRDNQKAIDKIVIELIESVDPVYFASKGTQDVRTHVSNISRYFCVFFHQLYDHMLQPMTFTIASIVSVFLLYDWRLGALTVGWIAVVGLVLGLTVKKQMNYAKISAESRTIFKKQRAEIMEQIQLYDAYGAKDFASKILANYSEDSAKNKFRFGIFNLLRNYLVYFIIVIFCVVGVTIFGLWGIPRGKILPKTFFAFSSIQSSIVVRVLSIFNNTAKFFSTWAQLRFSIGEIEKIKKIDNTIGGKINKINSIELKNFSVKRGGKFLIKELNLKIEPGELICIFADSGSGKTTLIKSIYGISNDYEGEILLNGKDRKTLNRRSINNAFNYVSQDPMIINGTVAENITLGKNITTTKLKQAINKTSLADAINKNDDFLNYNVGYGGSKLSGGQKQSLSNARALANNNKQKLWICDEVTTGLDRENAKKTFEAIISEAKKNNQGGLFISHDKNALGYFDKVLHQDKKGLWKIVSPDKLVKKLD
jgi:ABC-type bacteriocin/lantibiotic exporter with double-glycine peptidase domain